MTQNITQDAKYPHITKTRSKRIPGRIDAKCSVCKNKINYPDKGIGRANYAAWVTQHQH